MKSNEDSKKINEYIKQDIKLLKNAQKMGLITYVPTLCYTKNKMKKEGYFSCALLDGGGYGDVVVNIQKFSNHQSNYSSFIQPIERQAILFHETSHAEFDGLLQRFNLGQKNNKSVDALNRWVFSNMFRLDIRKTLSETFADTYGCLLLETMEKWRQSSKECIENIKTIRENDELKETFYSNVYIIDYLKENPYIACSTSLQKTLDNRTYYKNLYPKDLKKEAVLSSSQSLVEKLSTLDSRTLEKLLLPQNINYDFAVANYAQSYLDNDKTLRYRWDKYHKQHPAYEFLNILFDEVEKWVDKNKNIYRDISCLDFEKNMVDIYTNNFTTLDKIKIVSSKQAIKFKRNAIQHIKQKEASFLNTPAGQKAISAFQEDKKIILGWISHIATKNNNNEINSNNAFKTNIFSDKTYFARL